MRHAPVRSVRWLFGLWALAACATNDHSRLAKSESTATSASAGSSSSTSTASTSGGGGDGGSGGQAPSERDVPTKLTFVNGIVDEGAVSFCFVRYPDGPANELPWPSAAGLPFARAAEVDVTALGLSGHDIDVRAVSGGSAAIGKKTCAELPSAPGVVVRSLAVLPASVFGAPRHLVLASTGCLGGETHVSPDGDRVCGEGYAPSLPTAGLVAGTLSSLGSASALRMQFVHATRGLSVPATLAVAAGADGAKSDTAVTGWTFGAVAPNPPFDDETLADLIEPTKARVTLASQGGSADVLFAEAFIQGAVNPSGLMHGDGLAFVAVGAAPGVEPGPWWHDFTFVAVHSVP